ncbi:hypothetical protein AAG906_010571 [Vitis piasezkii]
MFEAIPLSEGGVPSSPLQRRYEMRRPPTTPGVSNSRPKKSIRHPLAKKARVLGPRESSAPPQPQPPTTESQIPAGMTPKGIIRQPMTPVGAQRFIPPTVEIPFGVPDDS